MELGVLPQWAGLTCLGEVLQGLFGLRTLECTGSKEFQTRVGTASLHPDENTPASPSSKRWIW